MTVVVTSDWRQGMHGNQLSSMKPDTEICKYVNRQYTFHSTFLLWKRIIFYKKWCSFGLFGSGVTAWALGPKGREFTSGQGHVPGSPALVGVVQETTNPGVSLTWAFLSLSLQFTFYQKINRKVSLSKDQKKKNLCKYYGSQSGVSLSPGNHLAMVADSFVVTMWRGWRVLLASSE